MSDMRWVTCDAWHEIETWDELPEIETWDEWHEMSDVRLRHEMSDMRWMTCDEWHVINWLWPYTFCEFTFLNPLVNPLNKPFLILWSQAEWRNDETCNAWHEKSDMWWVTWDRDMRWVTWDRDMRWVTLDEWRNDETWDEWHQMNDMWWVTCD